jgi:amino acid adenylation domain-containing protein
MTQAPIDLPPPNSSFDPFGGPEILSAAPSTDPQREIWTGAKIDTDASLAFNESVSLYFKGPLDVEALKWALGRLSARHEALHTTFSGDGLSILVVPPLTPDLPVLDWSGNDEQSAAGLMEQLLTAEVLSPFDLENGPLFRVRLARLGPEHHVLVFTAHHIICDGWSTAVVVKDLAALYSARLRGAEPELGPPEPFSEYARAQALAAASPEREAAREYWRKRFSGDIPVLELPTDRPRAPLRTQRADRIDVPLDPELIALLRKAGAKQGASLFSALLAGFQALLHRVTGQFDLITGIPAAGQSVGGHEQLVGHCVNMLPVRTVLEPATTFNELLKIVRSAMLDAYDHQELTFGALLRELPIPRDPSRLPLVSVAFNVDRGLGPEALPFNPPSLVTTIATNKRRFENFELFVNAVELSGKVTLEVQYNTDLFDRSTIERWIALYELMLRAAALDPAQEIWRLPALTERDGVQLSEWNRAEMPIPEDPRVHRLIERQAAATPDAVAVEFEGRTLTYRELDEKANRLARRLRARGVQRGVLAGLCVERGPEMIVGLLGVLKAGGAYVPLDPGYPLERLTYMVKDSGLAVLVTETRVRSELPIAVSHAVSIDAEGSESIANESAEPLPASADDAEPASPCYVIYTSGSTGRPKGVLVPHRSAANLLASVATTPGMTSNDVVLAITTLSFDIAVSEVILPLTVGARIVVVSREVAADGVRLLDVVRSRGITFIDATPATWRLLLAAGWTGDQRLTAICTGEAMPRDLAEALTERVPRVWNGYGPTETTVWSTFYEVPKGVSRVLIGRPVGNTSVYVLGAHLEPVPLGANGELFIGGEGVTLGYHNRPELTAERFLADPFRPGGKMYRTGDIVRFLSDGNLECLGRNDNQVKLRGFRIELGEIEDSLTHHPSIRQAAVILREDRPGDKRLVAYVVHQGGDRPADAALRAHVKTTLPEYMVPAAFVRLDHMPLTPSGKIDRKSLPAPVVESGAAPDDFVGPRTEAEEIVAALWKEALGIGRVDVHDDFFALGGHSLLASQILARLRSDHGIVLSFRSMFEKPTIEMFAPLVEEKLRGPSSRPTSAAKIPRRQSKEPARASLLQERLYLLEEMDPAQQVVHNLPAAWRLKGPLDPSILNRALDAVAERHETLRTTVVMRQGVLVQIVSESFHVPLDLVDVSDRPAEEREAAMEALFQERSKVEFDLAVGPLFRALLVKLGEDDHALFTLRHNVIWDGWSFDIFLKDMAAFYAAFAFNATLPATLPISYSDFAEWHRTWLEGPDMAAQVAFWKRQLAGDLPVLAMPTDRPRQAKQTHTGGNEHMFLAREAVDPLTAIARDAGGTLFMVLLAAFDTMLHRYTGETDILVGTPVRARTRPETENLIGVFVNNVILRMRLQPAAAFSNLVAGVRDVILDAFSNQETPLELLGGRPPVVRALFSLQDVRQRPANIGGASVSQVHVHAPAASNDMMLWAMESNDGLLVVLNYNADLFEGATIRRFLAQYRALLAAVALDPRRSLAELPILPDEEAAALADFASIKPAAGEGSVLSSFREHARGTPSAVAISGARTVTFGELDALTNRLARRLRKLGAGVGMHIAVAASGLAESAAAVLAASKAGVAIVVLEPSLSSAELGRLCEAAKVSILVVDGAIAAPAVEGISVVRLDAQGEAELAEESADGLEPIATETDVFLTLTSLQGAPTTTRIGARSLTATTSELARSLGFSPSSRVIVALPAASAASMVFTLAALASGAALVASLDVEARDPLALADLVVRHDVTVMIAPRATWRDVLRIPFSAPPNFTAVCYGPPLSPEVADELAKQGVRVAGAYGASTLHAPLTFGIAAPGQTGLRIGQPLVVQGNAVQRTGDRARWLADGALEWLGRTDGRAWIGGQLVDPGDATTILAKHRAIADVRVVARDRDGDARLVAYYVPRAGEDFTETELRRFLRGSVPPTSIPSAFVEIEAMPLDAARAVDVSKLPPPADEMESASRYAPPRTDAEKLLAELFSEALGVERVGVLDNFFDLGGYSLLCFRMLDTIEQRTGKRLSPRILLLDTLEQVAARIEVKPAPASAEPPPRYEPPKPRQSEQPSGLFGRLKRIIGRE